MYKIEEWRGEMAREHCKDPKPLGPGLDPNQRALVERLEVWGTNFTDPGPDYCEFRTFDIDGKPLATYRVEGY